MVMYSSAQPSVSPSGEILISVALITRNRPDTLERCLQSVRSQSYQPFEIVVSDDSDADYAAQTRAIAQRYDCRYLTGPQRGMQANRNHAHRACRGTHIRTMDDDHEFPPDHNRILEAAVRSDPTSIWVFGEYLEWPTPTSILFPPGEMQPRGYRRFPLDPDDCFAISDGCTVYPRSVVTQHPFIEKLKYAGEAEFGARLKALGYRIRYCPDTYIIHHCLNSGGSPTTDKALLLRSLFFGSYMTYGCYLRNPWKEFECLGYFLGMALRRTMGWSDRANDHHYSQLLNRPFTLQDFWQTWQLARHYRSLFEQGRYSEMV
ncbi:MAG: glycosyltransferase family 2 protein [Cyanobacteriota bacterium SKYGB_h_bin112]|nr:glycosyltransferase family 2 protein [Cyanobacteriota bacterium SKYGB_h_bin112]